MDEGSHFDPFTASPALPLFGAILRRGTKGRGGEPEVTEGNQRSQREIGFGDTAAAGREVRELGKASHGGHGGHGGRLGSATRRLQGEKCANWGKHRTEVTEVTEGEWVVR